MALNKLSTPARTSISGSACHWIASDNSVDFVFQRRDSPITNIKASGSNTRIDVITGINYGSFQFLDIYVEDIFNRYTGTWQIVSGGFNFFVIDTVFAGNASGFVNNVGVYPNYYVDAEVYDYRSGDTLGFLNFVPGPDGMVHMDFSALLKDNLELNTRYLYEMVNKREENWSISFGFRYSEVPFWTGAVGGGTVIEEGNQWYVAKAARQIGDEFGQNLRLFEIYPEANIITDENEALFLDEGVISTYFKTYPWTLSFLFGEQVSGVKYQRVVEEFDVNQTLIAGTNDTDHLAEVDQGYVNRLSLRKTAFNYGLTGMDADTKFLKIWIEETDVVTDDDLGGGGSGGGGGVFSGPGGGDASLLSDDAVGG